MAKFTDVEGQEVWVHGKRVGIIVEDWFYPVAGAQLASIELEEIVKEMDYNSSPLRNPGVETPPSDTQQASFMLDEKSMRQAKGRLHRRPVENDQSDSVSRSMKPSGDL